MGILEKSLHGRFFANLFFSIGVVTIGYAIVPCCIVGIRDERERRMTRLTKIGEQTIISAIVSVSTNRLKISANSLVSGKWRKIFVDIKFSGPHGFFIVITIFSSGLSGSGID